MQPDFFKAAGLTPFPHLVMKVGLRKRKQAIIRCQIIERSHIPLEHFSQLRRHIYRAAALGRLRFGHDLAAVDGLKGLGDGQRLRVEVYVGRRERQKLPYPQPRPEHH